MSNTIRGLKDLTINFLRTLNCYEANENLNLFLDKLINEILSVFKFNECELITGCNYEDKQRHIFITIYKQYATIHSIIDDIIGNVNNNLPNAEIKIVNNFDSVKVKIYFPIL